MKPLIPTFDSPTEIKEYLLERKKILEDDLGNVNKILNILERNPEFMDLLLKWRKL